MNITHLINANRVFSNYLDDKMPPALAYKIMKLVRAAEDEEVFYKRELQKLVEQYGKRNADGSLETTDDGNVLLAKETLHECRQKISELEALDVDTPNISFTVEELASISITVREMNAIAPFISSYDGT